MLVKFYFKFRIVNSHTFGFIYARVEAAGGRACCIESAGSLLRTADAIGDTPLEFPDTTVTDKVIEELSEPVPCHIVLCQFVIRQAAGIFASKVEPAFNVVHRIQ
jgi:hypothetical protein